MISLQEAKRLLCKERRDSFAGDGHDESGSMFCKWRTDSFAYVDDLATLQTRSDRDFESNCPSSPSGGQSFNCPSSPVAGQSFSSSPRQQSIGRRIDRRHEVAYLESLASRANGNGLTSELEQPYASPRQGKKREQPKARRNVGTIAVPSTQEPPARETHDQERLDAMQRVAREAAIREALEREMSNACNTGLSHDSNVQIASASLSRSREQVRLGQPSPRLSPRQSPHRSPHPHSRAPLNAQSPQRSTSNPTAQRAGSFDLAHVRQTASHFPVARSFSQTPPIRMPSFLQGVGWSAESVRRSTSFSSASPASKRVSPFDVTTLRSMSPSSTIRRVTSPRRTSGSSPRGIQSRTGQQVVTGTSGTQQAVAPHANINHSVADEAKRLSDLHKLRELQQGRHQNQDQQPNSPYVKLPTFLTPQSPQPSSYGEADIFWTPPPEAMPVCSVSPPLDGRSSLGYHSLSTLGATPSSPSMHGVALSEMTEQSLPHMQQMGLPASI